MVLKVTPSRVLKKLRSGQPAFCFKINTGDPRVAEIAAMSGIDCVWLDREHCPNDLGAIEHQIRACLLHGADAMVRVHLVRVVAPTPAACRAVFRARRPPYSLAPLEPTPST